MRERAGQNDSENLSAVGQGGDEVWGGKMAFCLGNTDLRSLGDTPGCLGQPLPPLPLSPQNPSLCGSFSDLPPIPVFKGWPEGRLIFFTSRCQTRVKSEQRRTSAEGAQTGSQRVLPLCSVCTSKKKSRQVTQKVELQGCEEGDLGGSPHRVSGA